MIELSILDCSNCGVCCTELGTPPFIGSEIYELPDNLRDEVLERNRLEPDRENSKLPCYWYDLDAKKCTQYKHRPMVCRDFEVGSLACQAYREYHGVL